MNYELAGGYTIIKSFVVCIQKRNKTDYLNAGVYNEARKFQGAREIVRAYFLRALTLSVRDNNSYAWV